MRKRVVSRPTKHVTALTPTHASIDHDSRLDNLRRDSVTKARGHSSGTR